MSKAIVCPHCQGKLRLRPTGAPRIRCHLCGKGFENPAATVIDVELLGQSFTAAAGSSPAPSPEMASPLASSATDAAEPANESPTGGHHRAFTTPIPAVPVTRRTRKRRTAAARRRLRARHARRAQPWDYVTAGIATLAVLAVLGLGIYVFRHERAALANIEESERAMMALGTVSATEGSDPLAWALAAAAQNSSPPKPLPQRLIGVWELRADEDRTGTMELRADGMAIVRAAVGGEARTPDFFPWFLIAENGDELEIEFGAAPGALGAYRLTLVMTDPDALTSVRTVHQSVEQIECHRFVRRTAIPVALPPQPPPP